MLGFSRSRTIFGSGTPVGPSQSRSAGAPIALSPTPMKSKALKIFLWLTCSLLFAFFPSRLVASTVEQTGDHQAGSSCSWDERAS
jgi:hypothetical protein